MCENPAVAERWEADRFANVILPDGETREVRVVEGHLFVCEGCCCGNADKGVPEVPRAAFKKEWKERGIRRRVHLSISGCLGPCAVANVVIHLEGVGGCARGRAESRGRSRRAGRRLALLQPLGRDARAPRHGEGAGRLSRARRSQGGVGRHLSSHAARQTGGAPANGLNASIDEDL